MAYSGSIADIGTVLRKCIRAKANLSKKCPTAREIVTLLELIMIWWPHPTATAVAIRDGRFLAVGADKERPPGSAKATLAVVAVGRMADTGSEHLR